MTFRKAIRKVHLCLGMGAGLLVFVIGLSGSAYVFEKEIRDSVEDYRYVEPQPGPMLPPSTLASIAERQLPDEQFGRVKYEGPRRAACVQSGGHKSQHFKLVYIDPYDGRVLKVKDMNHDFLHIIFSLHYRLLLRPDVGRTIVDYATLIFVAILVTGMINWWPRNWAAARRCFAIKWKARWRRRNYDLHRVLGIYAFSVMLLLALTGMVWGFDSFNDAVYWLASGGETRPAYVPPVSADQSRAIASPLENVDAMWAQLAERHPDAKQMFVSLPSTPDASIRYTVNPDRSTYYRTDHYYFDQYSLTELPMRHSWAKYKDATLANMLRRMNYDIHRGAILGLPGKILMFVASLIATSLPVTGFLIWWGTRH